MRGFIAQRPESEANGVDRRVSRRTARTDFLETAMYERDRREECKDVPWQQGRLLITNNTRYWSKELRDEVDDIERCTAYAHFSASDEGRGREYVHQFRNHEECVAAVDEHNDALKAANAKVSGAGTASAGLPG